MPDSKPSCHSDYVEDPADARKIQQLITLNTAPAHNLPSEDRVV